MQKNKSKFNSSYNLKKYCAEYLSKELSSSGFDIILGFESRNDFRTCTISFEKNHVDLCVNLNAMKKAIKAKEISMKIKMDFAVSFIANYIKYVADAKRKLPRTYFEGLAQLNAIDVYSSGKVMSVYSPLSSTGAKRMKHMYAINVLVAILCLNKIRIFQQTELTEEEKDVIEKMVDELLAFSDVPEIEYSDSVLPKYALLGVISRIEKLPLTSIDTVQDFPILNILPVSGTVDQTINNIICCCSKSDNAFLLGVTVRLIAQFGTLDIEISNNLIDTLNQYREFSVLHYQQMAKGSSLLRDNLFAIKNNMKAINLYMDFHSISTETGSVHSLN